MAGRITMWGAGQILHNFFGRVAEPPPFYYLCLIKSIPPTPYSTGSELDEPSSEDGYQRLEIENSAPMWISDSAVLNLVTNEIDLTFVTATADWGQIGYWALANAAAGGYLYAVGSMEIAQAVVAGDQAVVSAGELAVELGPFFTDEEF